jgi:predicted nuclease with TOPRIM domain
MIVLIAIKNRRSHDMIRKICLISITVIALIGFNCKPAGKYADLKEHFKDTIKINEEYISALEKANSPKEVAEAITELGNKMSKIQPRAEIYNKKYPELKNLEKNNPPSELKEELETIEQVSQKLITVSMKAMKYMMDPEVTKATQEMAKKLGRSDPVK